MFNKNYLRVSATLRFKKRYKHESIKQTIQSFGMDGSAYHAARCRCSGIGIIRADVILMGINLRGHTYAWRRDVRYGTNPEAIRFQACDDAPEGYPRRRACAVRRHALRGVVSVPVAQSTLRTRPRRDTRGMLSGRNGKQRDMLSCKGRHSPERSHDGSLHAPCPYRNPRPCAPPCRKGSQRRCHGNVPEHRASSNRAYHSRLRGKPLLRKVHGEDNAHATNGLNRSHRLYHRNHSEPQRPEHHVMQSGGRSSRNPTQRAWLSPRIWGREGARHRFPQAHGNSHRGWYAELRTCHLACSHPFRHVPNGNSPRCHLLRVA